MRKGHANNDIDSRKIIVGNHLAIIRARYLGDIITGRKTVECRLGKMGYPPHGQVQSGDIIWFKLPSGPVRALARVRRVRVFEALGAALLRRIRREWGARIRAPQAFWAKACHAKVATLIWLDHVCPLRPYRVGKSDRRAWVVLAKPPMPDRPGVVSRGGPA